MLVLTKMERSRWSGAKVCFGGGIEDLGLDVKEREGKSHGLHHGFLRHFLWWGWCCFLTQGRLWNGHIWGKAGQQFSFFSFTIHMCIQG
jgi:hypothetical protein